MVIREKTNRLTAANYLLEIAEAPELTKTVEREKILPCPEAFRYIVLITMSPNQQKIRLILI